MFLKNSKFLVTRTFKQWQRDKASRLAASLSYYAIFSLPPILVLSLAMAGLFFERSTAKEEILTQASDLLGKTGGDAIAQILENASDPRLGSIASGLSIILLLFGASGVFSQLQDALNTIWDVEPKPGRGIIAAATDRIFSIFMVLAIGFSFVVFIILNTILADFGQQVMDLSSESGWLIRSLSFIFSLGGAALSFAVIFKIVPNATVHWRDVWLGAVVTAVLFNIGNWAIGLYLRKSAPASTYGAAGSLIVLLLWVYYSANILFIGAEFTQVYANRFGNKIAAADESVPPGESKEGEPSDHKQGDGREESAS